MSTDQDFTQRLVTAIREHKPLPAFPPGLGIDEAYQNLTDVAAAVCDESVCGVKAGLTNPQIQEFFGLQEPLIGYLYDWGQSPLGATIPVQQNAQIECEIGIVLDDHANPIALAPAVEFVRLEFSKPEDFTAANLVLCSLGADRFILGEQRPWEDAILETLNDVTITLSKDGTEILRTTPLDSLGGPRTAMKWGVDEARKRGMSLGSQRLILAGTCGSGIPLEPGSYVADYATFGRIEFVVSANE